MTFTPRIDKFEIIISNQCNLRCKYCFVDKTSMVMTLEDVRKACDFINSYPSITPQCKVALFGGECLLHFDLVKECIMRLNKNFVIILYTNAILLDKEKLRWLAQFPNVTYNFSLDGDKYAHDKNRVYPDGSGSFDDVVERLKEYCEVYKTPLGRLGCKSVVSPDSFDGLMSTLKHIDEVPCYLSYCLARDPFIWDMNKMDYYEERLNEIADYYIEHFDEIEDKFDLFVWQIEVASYPRDYSCSAAKAEQLTIAQDLTLYPCAYFVSHDKKAALGTVETGIVNAEAFANIRSAKMSTIPECINCELYTHKTCLGHCPGAVAAYTGGVVNTVIPEVCEIYKILRRVSFRVHEALRTKPNYLKIFTRTLNHV